VQPSDACQQEASAVFGFIETGRENALQRLNVHHPAGEHGADSPTTMPETCAPTGATTRVAE
jgi:hypothetical protein